MIDCSFMDVLCISLNDLNINLRYGLSFSLVKVVLILNFVPVKIRLIMEEECSLITNTD
jgi:hypothetical protein